MSSSGGGSGTLLSGLTRGLSLERTFTRVRQVEGTSGQVGNVSVKGDRVVLITTSRERLETLRKSTVRKSLSRDGRRLLDTPLHPFTGTQINTVGNNRFL